MQVDSYNKLVQLEKNLDYSFKDKNLLTLALSHRSCGPNNNERLEFLGDSILSFIISEKLFLKFPKSKEGDLTRKRASLVCGSTLSEIAKKLELSNYLILGQGEKTSGGHQRSSILADAVEAIIGAIFLDSDLETVKIKTLNLFADKLNTLKVTECAKDAKTQLQEYLQARKMELPDYTLIKTEGLQHNQSFHVKCQVLSINKEATAVAESIRKAEQKAALIILTELGLKK